MKDEREIPDEISKIISKIIKSIGHEPTDEEVEKDWTQMGKLDKEDMGRQKTMMAEVHELKNETELLEAKVRAVFAKRDVLSREWWNYLYKKHGLPKGNFHIMEDGRIMSNPKGCEHAGD